MDLKNDLYVQHLLYSEIIIVGFYIFATFFYKNLVADSIQTISSEQINSMQHIFLINTPVR